LMSLPDFRKICADLAYIPPVIWISTSTLQVEIITARPNLSHCYISR
jgi:hypothetical protein